VSNNPVRAAELPDLIKTIHASLTEVVEPKPAEVLAPVLTPAVPVKKSVTDDFIICLEDGKKFKSLRRHLATAFNMTPEDYRAKWGLPRDYPMVAPGYASKRSELAKATGLGSARRKSAAANDEAPPAPAPVIEAPVVEAPAKRRGRPRKAA
jgi:predicted transcriptional regulator